MKSRMKNPALVLEGALPALQALATSSKEIGIPPRTLDLVHLRVSQINGCSFCVDMHARALMKGGDTVQRALAVSAWRETRYFTDAERAALSLAEAATRLCDRPDPVSDEVWEEAARHYDEKQLAALVLNIAQINLWNRLNVVTRQTAGAVDR